MTNQYALSDPGVSPLRPEFLPAISELLARWGAGDASCCHLLVGQMYPELVKIAGQILRNQCRGAALQPHELTHELYVRLRQQRNTQWHGPDHFLNFCGYLMRLIATDQLRQQGAEKRWGALRRVPLQDNSRVEHPRTVSTLDLNRMFSRLSPLGRRQQDLIRLRYLGGYTINEAANKLGVSPATVKRDLAASYSYLQTHLQGGATAGADA